MLAAPAEGSPRQVSGVENLDTTTSRPELSLSMLNLAWQAGAFSLHRVVTLGL